MTRDTDLIVPTLKLLINNEVSPESVANDTDGYSSTEIQYLMQEYVRYLKNQPEEEMDVIDRRQKNIFTWGCEGADKVLTPIEPHHFLMLAAPANSGKCLGKGTPVVMFDGAKKNVEEVVVGDLLMGDDSTPRKVLSLASGMEQMYIIKQSKGELYKCNESHILSLKYSSGKNKGIVRDVSIKEYLNLSKETKKSLNGYKRRYELQEKELIVEPYFLGLWLGDGGEDNVGITFQESEANLVEYLKGYAERLNLTYHLRRNKNRCNTHSITGTKGNSYKPSLQKSLNNIGVLYNKHIPEIYMLGSINQRLKLLAGLIDSDGYSDGRCYEIIQKRKDLALQIKSLAESLGFSVHFSKKIFTGECWRLRITGSLWDVPCKVDRKKIIEGSSKKNVNSNRIEVIKDAVDDYYGFVIDGNHRFLLGDSTVTHNTAYTFDMGIKNAQRGNKVLYLSLEMTTENIYTRMARDYAGITKWQWQDRSRITIPQRELYKRHKQKLKSIPFFTSIGIGAGGDKSIEGILSIIRQEEPDLVFVDNLNLINKVHGTRDENSNDEAISKLFMDFCKEENRAVILIHHLNKAGGIRGSQKIVDNLTGLYHCSREMEDLEAMEEVDRRMFYVTEKKDREFGKNGAFTFYFTAGTFVGSFEECIDAIKAGK